MGTTCYYREPGQTDLDHLQGELFSSPDSGMRLIDGATKNGAFYGALEVDADAGVNATGERYVTAIIVTISRGRGRDGFNFCRKEMDEGMGPFCYDCPERILDQLSPVEDCYGAPIDRSGRFPNQTANAADWRAACREKIAEAKARPSVRKGDTIRFEEPWTFRDGSREATFTCEDGRRNRYRGANGSLYRLPGKSRWGPFRVLTGSA